MKKILVILFALLYGSVITMKAQVDSDGFDEFPILINRSETALNGVYVMEGATVDDMGLVTYASNVYRFQEPLTKLRFTVKESGGGQLTGSYPFFSLSSFEVFDENGNEIELTEDMLYSNADHNRLNPNGIDGGGLAALIDDDGSTYFHSTWMTAVDDYHYLEVALPTGEYSAFSFAMTARNASLSRQFPAVLEITHLSQASSELLAVVDRAKALNIYQGTAPGFYNVDLAAFKDALAEAEALTGIIASDAEIYAAIDKLEGELAEIESIGMNMPDPEKQYRIISAGPFFSVQGIHKAMTIHSDDRYSNWLWWETATPDNDQQLFSFELIENGEEGGYYAIKNVATDLYVNNLVDESGNIVNNAAGLSESAGVVELKSLGYGQFGLFHNGQLHTGDHNGGNVSTASGAYGGINGVQSSIVKWYGSANSGSAWYIREVQTLPYTTKNISADKFMSESISLYEAVDSLVLTADKLCSFDDLVMYGLYGEEIPITVSKDGTAAIVCLDTAQVETFSFSFSNAEGVAEVIVNDVISNNQQDSIYHQDSIWSDVTAYYIKNADMSSESGWELKDCITDVSNRVFEVYAGWENLGVIEGSIKQQVTLPPGKYRLTGKAFFRQGLTYDIAPSTSYGYMVAGESRTLVPTLGSVEGLDTYANNIEEAALAFYSSDLYACILEFELTEVTTLAIGYECAFDQKQSWMAVGEMKLEKSGLINEADYFGDGVMASISEGNHFVYYTDEAGGYHFLHAADVNNWAVSDEPKLISFSAGNTADGAYASVASFMESNGYYMSNPQNLDGTGDIRTEAIDGHNALNKRVWESQVFYKNAEGKYAIRVTNATGTEWGANYFVNIEPATLDVVAGQPTLGDALYLWEIADEGDSRFPVEPDSIVPDPVEPEDTIEVLVSLPITFTVEDGLPGVLNEDSRYVWESPLFRLESSQRTLRFTVKETNSGGLDQNSNPYFAWAEFFVKDSLGNSIELTEDMITTNACHNTLNSYADGLGIAGMLDGLHATYFHSTWQVGADGYHYIQVTLPDGDYDCISFGFISRNSRITPTSILVTSEDSIGSVPDEPLLVESPWVGAVLDSELTAYLYNPVAQAFLGAGNSWGTQATFTATGLEWTVASSDSLYTISGPVSNGGELHYLGGGYTDASAQGFVIERVSDNIYTLREDNNYLAYDGTSVVVNNVTSCSENCYWQFVTREERRGKYAEATSDTPVNATFEISGANFGRNDQGNTVWTGNPTLGGDNVNYVAEKWNTDIVEVSQKLSSMPSGTYRLRAQGFYRMGSIDASVVARDNNTEELHAKFFANGDSLTVMSIMEEAGKLEGIGIAYGDYGMAPNSMNDVSRYFSDGLYEHSFVFSLDEGVDTIRLGVVKTASVAEDWLVFDNFRLEYLGMEVESYQITYMVDGEVYFTEYVVAGDIINLPEPPSKEGYTFSGWSDVPETMPAQDVTVDGIFTANSYTITYMIDNDVYRIDSIVYGMPITPPDPPVSPGYEFSGWSEYPAAMPARDLVITGTFIDMGLVPVCTDEQGVVYNLNEEKDAYVVADVEKTLASDVVIPDELYDLPVTAIADKVFMGTRGLKSIVIPASITTIGDRAFYGCQDLLVVEWNTSAPVRDNIFDEPSRHGNMLVFVRSSMAPVTYEGNVVINNKAAKITLTSGSPFRNPRAFTAEKITLAHEFTKRTKIGEAAGWEALVVPFNVQTVTSEKRGVLLPFVQADFMTSLPYWMATLQNNGTFVSSNAIKANTPFIMEVPNSDEYMDQYNVEGTVTFSASNVAVSVTTEAVRPSSEKYTLMYCYEEMSSSNNIYTLNDTEYAVAGGAKVLPGGVFVADSRNVRPFEAYVYSQDASRAPYLRIVGQSATGIEALHPMMPSGGDAWYTLQGVRLGGHPQERGVYIFNGRKVVIK